MMSTAVEAILGAVHLDGGDQALASVMTHLGLTSDLLVLFTPLTLVHSVL
jgi:ribonuclease-3